MPVINYLRACPLPEAKTKLDELAKLDPETVKRANSFFPFAGTPAAAAVPAKEKPADATSDEAAPKPPAPVASDTDKEPVKPATAAKQPAESPKPAVKAEKAEADEQEETPASTTGASLPSDKQKSVAATTAALPPPFAKDAAPHCRAACQQPGRIRRTGRRRCAVERGVLGHSPRRTSGLISINHLHSSMSIEVESRRDAAGTYEQYRALEHGRRGQFDHRPAES